MLDFSDLGGGMFDITFQMARRGQSIVLVRGATSLAAQIFIVAPKKTEVFKVHSDAGKSGVDEITLIGYRGVSGQTDADVERGDQFKIGSTTYTAVLIDDSIQNRREARFEGVQ